MKGRNGRASGQSVSARFYAPEGTGGYPRRNLVDHFNFEKLLKEVEGNRNISALNFSYSTLGDEGVILLAKALQKNTKLKTLHLADSLMTVKGLAAVLVMLRTNKTLLTVDVSRNLFEFKCQAMLEDLKLSLRVNNMIHHAAEAKKKNSCQQCSCIDSRDEAK